MVDKKGMIIYKERMQSKSIYHSSEAESLDDGNLFFILPFYIYRYKKGFLVSD